MDNLIDVIDNIQEKLFLYEFDELSNHIDIIVNKLLSVLNNLDENDGNIVKDILNVLSISLENKDYLLYNDVLEYELKPFLLAKGEHREG